MILRTPRSTLFPYTTLFRSRVARLTRSLIRSWQAKALAVRRVTENQGKRTRGVDRVLWDTPNKKWTAIGCRSEEHTSELQSPYDLVCRLLLEKKKKKKIITN